MLNAESLKTEILDEIANLIDADEALQKLGVVISEYFKNNAEISFMWIATNPVGGAPDPTTSANGSILSVAFSLTPSHEIDSSASKAHFESECNSALSLAQFNITDAGFSTAPAVFGSVLPLSLSIPETDNSNEAILGLSESIVDWLKSQIPASPVSGTHGVYVGTGTVISIN